MATETHYKDAGTWRKLTEWWYKDAGTWRKAKEVWYKDAGTWRKVFSGAIVFDWTVWNFVELGIATINFFSNGTVTGNQGSDTPVSLTNWYTPTTAGIGNSRWIEFNNDNNWLALSSTRSYSSDETSTQFTVPFRLSTTNSAAGVYRTGYISLTGGGS